MSIDAHLATLEKKHGELEAELHTVQAQPSVHDEIMCLRVENNATAGRGSGPELIDPKVQVHESAGVDGVDPARALIGDSHQIAIEKRLEVL